MVAAMRSLLSVSAGIAAATAFAIAAPTAAYAVTPTPTPAPAPRAVTAAHPQSSVQVKALPSYETWIADVTAVAAKASAYLGSRLPDSSIRPAIVLDIDNSSLQTTYRPGVASPAIQPILDVAQQAAAAGAAVFFVTARPQILGWQSEANLRGVGYPVDDIYLRPWFNTQPDAELKTAARVDIEAKGYTIVANIGNKESDLSGGHAERTFKLPDYNSELV
jgi:hypothetical protein